MSRKKILTDHKRKGKKFTPPLKQLGIMKEVRWLEDTFPEFLLVAVHNYKFGLRETANDIEEIIKAWKKVKNTELLEKTYLCISHYKYLKNTTIDKFVSNLNQDTLNRLLQSSKFIVTLFPACPLKNIIRESIKSSEKGDRIEELKQISDDCLSRTSKSSMEIQTHMLYAYGLTGRLCYSVNVTPPDLNQILNYPNTDESKREAASIRASVKAFCEHEYNINSNWTSYYWKRVYKLSPCKLIEPKFNQKPKNEDLPKENITDIDLIYLYSKEKSRIFKYFNDDLKSIRSNWVGELNNSYKFEVCSSLFSRISTITFDLLTNISFLMIPYPFILLRCISESYILLRWLCEKGGREEYIKFIEYGLGQEKLYIEHLKSIDAPDDSELLETIQYRERWLETNKYEFLIPVNVSNNPFDLSIRDMAIEVGDKDFFDFEYSLYSNFTHGHWNSISRLYMTTCLNPLHGLHLVPFLHPQTVDFKMIDKILNYYELSLDLIYQHVLFKKRNKSLRTKYWKLIDSEFKKIKDKK